MDAINDARAGVARRDGLPVLNFFILVYRCGETWCSQSVFTGDVAESRTEHGALDNLLRSIDLAIEAAEAAGISVEQWHAGREALAPDKDVLAMFKNLLATNDPVRERGRAPRGDYFRNVTVARTDAA